MNLWKWVGKKIHKLSMWDFAVLKAALVLLGIIIGAYISAFVQQYVWYFVVVFVVLYAFILYGVLRKK